VFHLAAKAPNACTTRIIGCERNEHGVEFIQVIAAHLTFPKVAVVIRTCVDILIEFIDIPYRQQSTGSG
jgi:hypothetical protein